MTATPPAGIRLRGGALIPPAPSLGRRLAVTADGHYLGAACETTPGQWVPVCAGCAAPLDPCISDRLAKGALYGHWQQDHMEAA